MSKNTLIASNLNGLNPVYRQTILRHLPIIRGECVKYPFPMVYNLYGNTCDFYYIYECSPEYKNRLCHSVNGQPAIICYNRSGYIIYLIWCYEGKVHREHNLPAVIGTYSKVMVKNHNTTEIINKINRNFMRELDDQYND